MIFRRVSAMLLVVVAFAATGAWPQEAERGPRPGPADPELREALFRYFENRLRVDLGLTDEQIAEVVPRVRAMERERVGILREKQQASMELRQAYRSGAADAELESLLGRVEETDRRLRSRMDELMGEIDGSMTVRQRVEFRAFLQRFRREMRERVQRLRGSSETQRRGRPPGARPGNRSSTPDPP